MSQEKREIVNLPEEIVYKILDYKTHRKDEQFLSVIAISHSIFGHNLFQTDRILAKLTQYIAAGKMERIGELRKIRPDLAPQIPSLLQSGLFALAGFAKQEQMEAILKAHPELFFIYAPLKDISGVYPVINDPAIEKSKRGITVFQHALWAGDTRYMCNMMLDCLPKNEKGETIRIELLRQYKELMDKGVVYELDGVTREEKQFSLEALIKALRDYDKKPLAQKGPHWCTVVGLAQTHLPAIVRHHYCDPEALLWETPLFTKAKLIRSLTFYNCVKKTNQLWNDSLTSLGSDFGITIPGRAGRAVGPGSLLHYAIVDLQALTTLREVRTKIDLPMLIMRLNSPILSPEEDHTHIYVSS